MQVRVSGKQIEIGGALPERVRTHISAAIEKYFDGDESKLELDKFPALKLARGYEVILEHGDTLFMPAGYWHHMEYLDSGFAMSLRALQSTLTGKMKGVWYLLGMRNIDTLLKKAAPEWWYNLKKEKTFRDAGKELENAGH